MVSVLSGRYGLGFPVHKPGETAARAVRVPFGDAIRMRFDFDSYFVSYESDLDLRMKKGSERSIVVSCRYLFLDVDFKQAKLSQEWRSGVSTWVRTLPGELGQWAAHYHTPHGWRLVYIFSEPVTVEALEHEHARISAELREYGVDVDPATKDWTRLLRTPYATKEDGSKTWELVDPAVQFFGSRRIQSTYIPVPTRAQSVTTTTTAPAKRHLAPDAMPDPVDFLAEVIENFNGKWPRTGRDGARFRAALKRVEADLNGPMGQDRSKQVLAENIRTFYEQRPVVENRNSTIHQMAWWVVNQLRRIQSSTLTAGSPIEAKFVSTLEAFRWMAPTLFAMDQDPEVSSPDSSEKASTWYEHGWIEVENACDRINDETETQQIQREQEAERQAVEVSRSEQASPNFVDGQPDYTALRQFFRAFFQHNSIEISGPDSFLFEWEDSDEALDTLLRFVRLRAVMIIAKGEMSVLNNHGVYSQIHHTREGLNKAIQMAGNPLGIRLFSVHPETGVIKWLDGKELESRYAVPISRQEYFFADTTNPNKRTCIQHTGTEDIVTVYNPSAWWNSQVVCNPRFSPVVHEWLYSLSGFDGPTFFRLLAWLAHFQDQSLYLPALVLGPHSRTGKSLLISALRDFYNINSTARDALAELGLSRSRRAGANIQTANPLAVSEEGLVSVADIGPKARNPEQIAIEVSTRLKEFITQREQRIRLLYQQRESVLRAAPRIVLASNDSSDAEALITAGGNGSAAAVGAQQNRILYVKCVEESIDWMNKHSNQAMVEGWAVTNHMTYNRENRTLVEDVPTSYTIARHIAWLFRNRHLGAPVNIGDWENTGSMMSYAAIVRNSGDMLLSLLPTESAEIIVRGGSEDRQQYLDLIAILLRHSLTDNSGNMAPKAGMTRGVEYRCTGVYYCPAVSGFVLNSGVARERIQTLRQFSRMGNRATADKLENWGFRSLLRKYRTDLLPLDQDDKPVLVRWQRALVEQHPYSLRIIPRRVMLEHLQYSEQYDILHLLEEDGII